MLCKCATGTLTFQNLAPCFIDDCAPAAVKGKVLAAFFMAVPVGQALGYGYGGFMCSALDPVQIGFAGVEKRVLYIL